METLDEAIRLSIESKAGCYLAWHVAAARPINEAVATPAIVESKTSVRERIPLGRAL